MSLISIVTSLRPETEMPGVMGETVHSGPSAGLYPDSKPYLVIKMGALMMEMGVIMMMRWLAAQPRLKEVDAARKRQQGHSYCPV